MKSTLIFFLMTGLILTGCSAKNIEEVESDQYYANENIETDDEVVLNGLDEVNTLLTKRENNLMNILEKFNIGYNCSPNKQIIKSNSRSYKKYDNSYDQYINYDVELSYTDENLRTRFVISKQFHQQSEINYNDSYLKLITEVIKSQDKSFKLEDLKSSIEECKNSDNIIDTILENDDIRAQVDCYAGVITVYLSCDETIEFTNTQNLVNEYETVSEFKNKATILQEKEDSINIHEDAFAVEYSQNTSGELSETYEFYFNADINVENDLLNESYKSNIDSYIQYMSDTIGLDLSKYITTDELYIEINESIYRNKRNIYESVYLPMGIGTVWAGSNFEGGIHIEIDIEIPVMAEGVTKL